MWDDLLIACIGEMFEDPDVVGVVLHVRIKEDTLFVWNRDSNQRNKIWEKLRQILQLPANCPGVEYKSHKANLENANLKPDEQDHSVERQEASPVRQNLQESVSGVPTTEGN